MDGISAQDSTLEIGTGTGDAIVITGISIGFPAIVTAADHGLSNGHAVALAAIVGSLSVLNGQTLIISNVTEDTFALSTFDSTGLVYTSNGTATPVEYTEIGGVVSFDGIDGAAADLDNTDLKSTAMESISGLVDNGSFGFEMKRLKADLGQQALVAAKASGLRRPFRLTLPDGGTYSFNALVKSIPLSGAVNTLMKTKVATKITGAVVEA